MFHIDWHLANVLYGGGFGLGRVAGGSGAIRWWPKAGEGGGVQAEFKSSVIICLRDLGTAPWDVVTVSVGAITAAAAAAGGRVVAGAAGLFFKTTSSFTFMLSMLLLQKKQKKYI